MYCYDCVNCGECKGGKEMIKSKKVVHELSPNDVEMIVKKRVHIIQSENEQLRKDNDKLFRMHEFLCESLEQKILEIKRLKAKMERVHKIICLMNEGLGGLEENKFDLTIEEINIILDSLNTTDEGNICLIKKLENEIQILNKKDHEERLYDFEL